MKLNAIVFCTLSCLVGVLAGCDGNIDELCESAREFCVVPATQNAQPTVTTSSEDEFPSWCDENAATNENTADAITDFGKWTATCNDGVWTLMIAKSGEKTVTATAVKNTDPTVTSTYTGTMAYNCTYLVPSNPSAPVITGWLVALSQTTVYVSEGSCKLIFDTENQ